LLLKEGGKKDLGCSHTVREEKATFDSLRPDTHARRRRLSRSPSEGRADRSEVILRIRRKQRLAGKKGAAYAGELAESTKGQSG